MRKVEYRLVFRLAPQHEIQLVLHYHHQSAAVVLELILAPLTQLEAVERTRPSLGG